MFRSMLSFYSENLLVPCATSLASCRQLLIQYIRSYRPYRSQFLPPHSEDAPCCGDRDPLIMVCFRYIATNQHVEIRSTTLFFYDTNVAHKLQGTYVEIKCQLDTTEVFFIADLIACSTWFGHHYAHHQELKSIIQWLLPVVFRAVVFKLLVWCGAEGYVSGLQDVALKTASCKPDQPPL